MFCDLMLQRRHTMQKRNEAPQERLVCAMATLTWGIIMTARTAVSYFAVPMGLTAGQLGTLGCAMSVAAFLSALLVGKRVNRSGRIAESLIVALLGTAVCLGLTSLTRSFRELLTVRIVMGAFAGPMYTLLTYAVRLTSREERYASNIGLITLGEAMVSGILWPSLVVRFVNAWGWRRANGTLLLPLALFLLAWGIQRKRIHGTVRDSGEKQAGSGFLELMRYRNIPLCCLYGVLAMLTAMIIYSYAPMYWIKAGGCTDGEMGTRMTVMGIFMAGFSLILPAVSDRWGRKVVVIPSCAIASVTLFAMYFAPTSRLSAVLFSIFGGFPSVLPLFAMAVISVESVPLELCAVAVSLVNGICELLGSALGPLLGGLAADRGGITAAMLMGAVCMTLCVPVTALMAETNGRKKRYK